MPSWNHHGIMAERPKKYSKTTARVSTSDKIELSVKISQPLVPPNIDEETSNASVKNGKLFCKFVIL